MGEIQTYADGTPDPTDKVPFVSDPTGTPALKLVAVSALGGGEGWTLAADEDGTSMTNWTAQAGTWGISDGGFHSSAGGAHRSLYLTNAGTIQRGGGALFAEAEVYVPDVGGTLYAGLGAKGPSGLSYVGGRLLRSSGTWVTMISNENTANDGEQRPCAEMAVDTWHKVWFLLAGNQGTLWVDEVFASSGAVGNLSQAISIGPWCYATNCTFRNFKMWVRSTASLPV